MKTIWFFSVLLVLFSCQEGDDVALFNNVNEVIIELDIPITKNFDRHKTPVIIGFHDNPELNGEPVALEQIFMLEWDKNDQKRPTSFYRCDYMDLLPEGSFYAYAAIDLNRNESYDKGEPFQIFEEKGKPKEIIVLAESRRIVKFDF